MHELKKDLQANHNKIAKMVKVITDGKNEQQTKKVQEAISKIKKAL